MVLTALEDIGFIAIRPTYLDKNALFGQQICHMQQLAERPNLGSKLVCAFSGARLRVSGEGARLVNGPSGRPAAPGTGMGWCARTTS